MSLLTMIQDVTDELGGISRPTLVTSTANQTVRQLLALANREGKEMAKKEWPILTREISITTTGAELQGDLETLAGEEFDSVINDTFWDATTPEYVRGSLTPSQWAFIKNHNSGVYRPHARIQRNPSTNKLALYLYPAPAAGRVVRFSIKSKKWCANADRTTLYDKWQADTDVGLLPESLMALGLKWRWKAENKLEYAEDKRTYEMAVAEELANQLTLGSVDLEGPRVVGDGFPLGPGEGWRL